MYISPYIDIPFLFTFLNQLFELLVSSLVVFVSMCLTEGTVCNLDPQPFFPGERNFWGNNLEELAAIHQCFAVVSDNLTQLASFSRPQRCEVKF